MPFLQLSMSCKLDDFMPLESALESVGALAVTMSDAHLDAADEQAIFEPGVGETPLWNEMQLQALFPGDSDAEAIRAALATAEPSLDFSGATFEVIEDQDWERAWMDQYEPLQFGRRTWIVPWNAELPAAAAEQGEEAAVIRLDPGLAFGSGTHPTTALCLSWLDGLADRGLLNGQPVLDFGCGSGILALAALRLGAASAVGVDNDPQAVTATADNAERNGLDSSLTVYLSEQEPTGVEYPVVVANILAKALVELNAVIGSRVAPGGVIAMSGILKGQEDEVIAAYDDRFTDFATTQLEDWMLVTAVRRG